MSDIIKLLPESIANQIAAGEVIQRPASVIKELMENAIDAESTEITIVLKNSGKTLIQVIDNGKGMTSTDARLSFERHATSKLQKTEDLFAIKTMGFRGEALASIASIAEVNLKTKTESSELATEILIRASEFLEQKFVQGPKGTTISVKNLFFNVPARRKFLRSDAVEYKYIIEEFKRVSLAHPEIKFKLIHNGNEVYNLSEGSLKKRILALFRKTYEDKLIRIEENTDIVKIGGLIGCPEITKKQKGEQYLFVNRRFVKSAYLSHAIKSAYQNLVEEKGFPFFVLFLDIDPSAIDVNVHPTKQEIKFDDERLIYSYLKVSIKHGLGRFSLSPQLDFENENQELPAMTAMQSSNGKDSGYSNPIASKLRSAPVLRNWQNLYSGEESFNLNEEESDEEPLIIPSAATGDLLNDYEQFATVQKQPVQIHNCYIMVQIKSGFMIIHQHHAHVRILYEKYLSKLKQGQESIQKQLFPITVNISKDHLSLFEEILPEITNLGFDIQNFGGSTYVIHGIPTGFTDHNIQEVINNLVDQYAQNLKLDLSKNEVMARSFAYSSAIKSGKALTLEEMQSLIDELFACEFPYTSPSGTKCFITHELLDLEKSFK